jgi:iron complex transport system ATP-binding protein
MLLRAEHLSFAFSPDRPVLRDVSLSLTGGEMVALLGPNGSGKSTLIRAVLGHLPTDGAVRWLDRDARQWPPRELAKVAAYLPQSPADDAGYTVGEILRLGRSPYWGAFGVESPEDEKVVRDVARQLSLEDLLARPVHQLSGGQRQRVFIGRCLVQQPKALLLDEPSTFLDLKHQIDLCRLLKSLTRGLNLAVLMASHDLNLASSFADRAILLSEGTVAADAAPGDVLRPKLLSKVYGLAMERIDREGRAPVVAAVV